MSGFGIKKIFDTGAGVFSAAAAILAVMIVSVAKEAPSQETQDEVMDLRYPEGMSCKNGEAWMDDSKKNKKMEEFIPFRMNFSINI